MSHLQNCSLKIYLKCTREGVRMDVNEELKFFVKTQKNIFFFFLGGGGIGSGGRVGGGGQGRCEQRSEVLYYFIFLVGGSGRRGVTG